MVAGNPRPEELDETWPEPEQSTWVALGLALVKSDGTPVQAELLRPRAWVERAGLRVGAPLPIAVAELDIQGEGRVTAIAPCPPLARGEGRVVTGRFLTRSAGNVVRVTLENDTTIRVTDVHPVWSVDREEWVPAGELEPGEQVAALTGPVAVREIKRLESALDVYNIEVHGEHVFRVTADGVLVHNGDAEENCAKIIDDARKAVSPNTGLFRGGSSLQARLGVDVNAASDGLIHPWGKNGKPQGLSLNTNPHDRWVQEHGGAFPVNGLPDGLQVLQSGKPGHFVIAPQMPMTLDDFQRLLNQVTLGDFNVLP